MTALTAGLCALFVFLGHWQWEKGLWRQAEWDAFARGADRPVALGERNLAELPRFQRVEVAGTFDPTHQFLLDNRIHAGQAGYEVLTPLALAEGRVLLVDRGWVPLTGFREHLPDVHFASPGRVTITGRLDFLPAPGLSLGRMPPAQGPEWPKLTSYPDMTQLSLVLGAALPERIVLLDPGAPFGYVRDWQPPGMSPARHLAYAIQWWGFAVTLLIIWAVLSAPRSARPSPRAAH